MGKCTAVIETVLLFFQEFSAPANRHVEFRDRVRKTLYYGQYSDRSLPSLAVTGKTALTTCCVERFAFVFAASIGRLGVLASHDQFAW